MKGVVILWHPTVKRVIEALQPPDDHEVFLVLPSSMDLRAIGEVLPGAPRVSLLATAGVIQSAGYGLLRQMQRNQWRLAFCHTTDDLATGSLDALEKASELAQKFRIDVDFLLTLPGEGLQSADAVRVFEFLAANSVRRVSFAYPLLLSKMGLEPGKTTRSSEFFETFFDAWLASNRALVIDDAFRLSSKLEAARAAAERPLNVVFMDGEFAYQNADGPIAELRDLPKAADNSRDRCARSCEYYLICGGDIYGAKALFNGTLDSADNPYCTLVAKPLFARSLAGASR